MADESVESHRWLARRLVDLFAALPGRSLQQRLEDLVELASDLDGAKGALALAVDSAGHPLACAQLRCPLAPDSGSVRNLELLATSVAKGVDPTLLLDLDRNLLDLEVDDAIDAFAIRLEGRTLGLIAVRRGTDPLLDLVQLERLASVAWIPLQDALESVSETRIRQLESLARTQDQSGNLGGLVRQLKEIFDADIVTLLFQAGGLLRLAATTDQALWAGPSVRYPSWTGLTGWVWSSKQALRLSDSLNQEEINEQTTLPGEQDSRIKDREGPLHAEHGPDGQPATIFLAVPLVRGGTCVGVLRISRSPSRAPFTAQDQTALAFLADLLGVVLQDREDLLLLEQIFEGAGESIIVSHRMPEDPEGINRVTRANPGAVRMFGTPLGELRTKDALALYLPADRLRVQKLLRAALRRGENDAGPLEVHVQRPDGTSRPVEIRFRMQTDSRVHPPIPYVVGMAREMSESLMLGSFGFAYYRADADGRTLVSSDRESTLTGYSRVELARMGRSELFANDNQYALLMKSASLNGGRLLNKVVNWRDKQGEIFAIELNLLVTTEPSSGKIEFVEGIYRSIQDRIQVQKMLGSSELKVLNDQELLRRLEAQNRSQKRFVLSVGHQIASPLTAIDGRLKLIEEQLADGEDVSKNLEYALGQTRVATMQAMNMSHLLKLHKGDPFPKAMELLRRPLALLMTDYRVIADVEGIRLNFVEKNKAGKANITEETRVWANQDLLRQVLGILIENAIKYSDRGTTVTVIRDEKPKTGLTLEVANLGLLIPTELWEKIFEWEYRTPRAQIKRPGQGTGIGLHLAQMIMASFGGGVTVDRGVGQDYRTYNVFRLHFLTQEPR